MADFGIGLCFSQTFYRRIWLTILKSWQNFLGFLSTTLQKLMASWHYTISKSWLFFPSCPTPVKRQHPWFFELTISKRWLFFRPVPVKNLAAFPWFFSSNFQKFMVSSCGILRGFISAL